VQVLHGLKELSEFDRSFGLALGVFDGIHLGHQAVIEAARGAGALGVLTFDPHPVEVLAPNHAPRRVLSSLDQKERILSGLGVDFLVIIKFSPEFAAREARKFADDLFATGVKKLSAGDDWSFGRGREGNMQRLREWGNESGVDVLEISAILQDGLRISSTRIRKCLQEEDLDSVATMPGRHYSVLGKVIRGRQLGRTIGFPTANVVVADEVLPPNGVYVVEGNGIPGVANIGTRPTVDDGRGRSLEVHLFSDDLPMDYGWELEVGFLRKIRDEKKFQSLEELRKQIEFDVQNAQRG
jgi:riboflavin kinase/FMN adenylyltransferase